MQKENTMKGVEKQQDKEVLYPMILPIVFYDGIKNWLVSLGMKERIDQSRGIRIHTGNANLLKERETVSYRYKRKRNNESRKS